MRKIIVWVDVESAGTSSGIDPFLEVAVVFTDFAGNIIAEPYAALVTVKDLNKVMRECKPEIQEMHDKSGLWRDLWNEPTKTAELIDEELQRLLDQFSGDEFFVFGGNSLDLDRRFAELYLPGFYRRISHRNVDVTTISMVFQEKSNAPMFVKRGCHRALADTLDSVDEYRHYMEWLRRRLETDTIDSEFD